jgi:molybdopterin-guanine dinucleotide biosynthesis protein A
MKPYKNAVIFAGGKSSRMGEDKALLPFADYSTLTEFQYKKLQNLFENVYISAKENKFDFTCQVIEDIHTTSSPLVGILSIFEVLKVEDIFILSVDAPFVDEKVISKIMQTSCKKDACIAKSPNGIQPLCGLYKKSILTFAKEQYTHNDHKLHHLLSKASIQTIDFESEDAFLNLNHPQEYQDALRRLFHR